MKHPASLRPQSINPFSAPSLHHSVIRTFGLGLVVVFFLSCSSSHASVSLRIGQNFVGATYGTDSTALPPDACLAAGPNHVAEFINGRFSVFTKTNGTRVQTKTDLAFWSSAGVSAGSVSDPRILFDPASQRWFASMVDVPSNGGNRFLLAVSASSDPTGTWHGVAWTADPVSGDFADFPTLGIDANGVYLSGDMFDNAENSVGPLLVSLPKADLLANPPSIAGRTSFGVLDYDIYGAVLQPAITLGAASSEEAVLAVGDLGYDFQPHSNLVTVAIENAASAGGATLTNRTSLPIPSYSVPINPPQPGGVDNLDDGDARLSGCVYRVGDVLYAVHAVQFNNRAAIQWFEVSALTRTVIQSGRITDPVLHLFFPAITANNQGTVAVVFNGCSTNTFISSYAVIGEHLNGNLSFGNPVLLRAGTVAYRTSNPNVISRWGDYSAICPDPSDPARFWSLTIYPSSSTAWSTRITELITEPLVLSIQPSVTNVTLGWSASVSGYQLQSTPSLAPAIWTTIGATPLLANDQYTLLLPATSSAAYFRLIK